MSSIAAPMADAPLAGLTGRGVRVAVVDSGAHPANPHIRAIAGGVLIGQAGPLGDAQADWLDALGHGTAVMAAIQEQAPDAECHAVRVFEATLSTTATRLIRAIEWSIDNGADIVNLSLGTPNPAHRAAFEALAARAAEAGTLLVSARQAGGEPSLPGSLPGVIGVDLDWDCPEDRYGQLRVDDRTAFAATGYPRAIEGVPQRRNLYGISFAVARLSGFAARACQRLREEGRAITIENVNALLAQAIAERPAA